MLAANPGTGVAAAFDRSSRVLFVLDSGNDEAVGFLRRGDGSLTALQGSLVLTDGAAGLLAR